MQVETCPVGVPFGHATCGQTISSLWTAITTSGGSTLTETVQGLNAGKRYKWRSRVLYAPFTVLQAGITAPPNPAHGPWKRLSGRAEAEDGDILMNDVTGPLDMPAPADEGLYSVSDYVIFSWPAASDPDSDVTSYDLQIGTTPGGNDVIDGNIGNRLTRDFPGLNGQTLYARVRAVNTHGVAGNWSPSSDGITIDTTAPSMPGVPVDAGGYSISTAVTFSWTAAADAESGIAGYTLQVGTTPGGNDVFNGSVGNVLTREITGSNGQTLYARVQAVNGAGTATSWSGNSDGITIDATAPSMPGVPVDAGAYSTSTVVTFTWTTASDAETGIAGYNLQVGTTPGGNNVFDGSVGNVLTREITGSNGQTLYARVQAVNGAGTATAWSGNSNGITIDTTAPSTPGVPVDAGAYSTSAAVMFIWTAASDTETGITGYNMQVGTTPGGTDVFDGSVGNVSTREITGSNGQTLYARVQAVNGAGTATAWSGNSDGITIDIVSPTLDTDAIWRDSTHVDVVFSEPVNGATNSANYTADNGLNIISAVSQGGGTYRLATSLQTAGTTYTIAASTVNITDPAGNRLSGSSSTATFTRTYGSNIAPTRPSISSPASSSETATVTPILAVNTSIDADGDPITYTFEVSAASDFSAIAATASGITATSWTVSPALSDNTVYYWRALASDGYVNSSWMAMADLFVNASNDAPGDPAISSPSDNSQVDSLTPVLSVGNAADLDIHDTLAYDFDVAADAGFSNIVSGAAGAAQGGSGTTSWTVATALTENTLYFWRARAADNHGGASNWVAASFLVNTANHAPTAPGLNAPANAGEVAALTTALAVDNATDADHDSLHYVFEIDTVNTFNSVNKQTSSLLAEGGGTTNWTPSALAENVVYYWRARANDGKSDGPWMATASFLVNTVNDAPSVPTLNYPANNGQVTVLAPTFQVNASTDPDNDKLAYEYEVYSDSGLVSLVASTAGAGRSWTVDHALSDRTAYWWRAQAADAHGSASGWMAANSFTVNNTGANDPPAITMTTPGSAEPIVYGNSYTITWTAFDPDSIATVIPGYDTTGMGCNGSHISTGISENDGPGDYIWDVTNLAPGTYYVYASITDGMSTICAYGAGPIIRSNSTGDLDIDGDVDTVDALKALRFAAGIVAPTGSDISRGDVAPLKSGAPVPDGKIDIGDVVVILRKSVGLISW